MPEGNPTSHGTPCTWAQIQEGREPPTTSLALGQTLTSLTSVSSQIRQMGGYTLGRGVSVWAEDHCPAQTANVGNRLRAASQKSHQGPPSHSFPSPFQTSSGVLVVPGWLLPPCLCARHHPFHHGRHTSTRSPFHLGLLILNLILIHVRIGRAH